MLTVPLTVTFAAEASLEAKVKRMAALMAVKSSEGFLVLMRCVHWGGGYRFSVHDSVSLFRYKEDRSLGRAHSTPRQDCRLQVLIKKKRNY